MSESHVTRAVLQTALNGLQRYGETARAVVPRDEGRIRAAQTQISQAIRVLETNVQVLERQIQDSQTHLQRTQANLHRTQSAMRDSHSGGYGFNLVGYEVEVRTAEQALRQRRQELRQQEDQLRQGKLLERQMTEAAAAFLNQATHLRAFLDHDLGNAVGFVRDRLTALIEYESGPMTSFHSGGGERMQLFAPFEIDSGLLWGKEVSSSFDPSTQHTDVGNKDRSWWEVTLFDQQKTLSDLALWVNSGTNYVPTAELPDPQDISGENDFKKVPMTEMKAGLEKLQEMLPIVERGEGTSKDYWASFDTQKGLDYEHGYQRIYEAFYGDDAIRLNRNGNQYDIVNGRHRIWLAKRMGITNLPARVIEKK